VVLKYSPGVIEDRRVRIAYRKDAEKLDFKVPEDIDKLPKIFEEFKNPPDIPWHLTPHLYFRPFLLGRQGEISSIPCLWMDCDKFTPDIEAKLNTFRPPSIILQTSPQRCHFFWILKHPLEPKESDAIIKIHQRLAKAFGGDSLPTWNLDYVSRVPGSINMKHCIKKYWNEDPFGGIPPNAFEVTYSATQEEFELGDFGGLLYLTLTDHLRSFMRLTAWWRGEQGNAGLVNKI
jgi:hypothetical protein